jgi:DNA-binding transcriptional ArsR family regulator
MTGRTKTQRARDERNIASLYLKGELQGDIAESLGLSQSTVSRALKSLQQDWRSSALIDINEAKARELAKIDALEMEYWTAWKRSQEDAESEITKMQGTPPKQGDQNPAPAKLETQKKREGQSGNPAFLRGVEWCINKRCEIIGVNAPVKSEVEHKGGIELVKKTLGVEIDKI